MRIVIAGSGIVGGALARYLDSKNISYAQYDPPRGMNDSAVFKQATHIFICVPTPYTEVGFDLRIVDEVFPLISGGSHVIIKSTVLPGTTEEYQVKYPKLKVYFSPEFLTEKTANEDFAHPTRQIVGYTKGNEETARQILELLPLAVYRKIVPARVAEMIKYMNNVFYALKVTYANQVYDICDAFGIDYAAVAEGAVSNEPWMGKNHWDVFFGGYRGYGGKCLPKDIRSLIQLGMQKNLEVSLLQLVEKLNNERRASGPKQ